MPSIKSLYKFLSSKYQNLFLEYQVNSKPNYGHSLPAHSLLLDIISKNDANYAQFIEDILQHKSIFESIQLLKNETNENLPAWNNEYLPGLDIMALYTMIRKFQPTKYIEVGSGNSTKVARKAITDGNLKTQITSIDPYPRANIDHLADIVIREPFENLKDLSIITESLGENDILFIDNSHRVFPNSDGMKFFMEILPKLKKGVIVQIHDIYLPYDYPQFMCDRFYNEQYLLAAFVMANPNKYECIFPNYYVSEQANLAQKLAPIWQHETLSQVEKHGGSFWLKMNE